MTGPRPPLGQVLVGTLSHGNCNVYWPQAFETLIHENVTDIVFFTVCKFICNFASISCGFGQLKRILWLFLRGELHVRDLKKHEIFAEVNKNLPELSVFVSMLGENPTVIKLAVYNVNLSLCDLRDFSA